MSDEIEQIPKGDLRSASAATGDIPNSYPKAGVPNIPEGPCIGFSMLIILADPAQQPSQSALEPKTSRPPCRSAKAQKTGTSPKTEISSLLARPAEKRH